MSEAVLKEARGESINGSGWTGLKGRDSGDSGKDGEVDCASIVEKGTYDALQAAGGDGVKGGCLIDWNDLRHLAAIRRGDVDGRCLGAFGKSWCVLLEYAINVAGETECD